MYKTNKLYIEKTKNHVKKVFDDICEKRTDICRYKNEVEYNPETETAYINTSVIFDKPLEYVTVEFTKDMFPQMSQEQFEKFCEGLKDYIDSGKYLEDEYD